MTVSSIISLLIVAALVAAGTGLALAHVHPGAACTGHLLFTALLPPPLFEAALSLSWAELRRDAGPILTLATGGVVISALVVTGGMTLRLGRA